MWALLQYDLKKNKRSFIITVSIFLALIICLVIPKKFMEHNVASAGALALGSCLFCCIFGYMYTFRKMFHNRFIKDCILNYTTVSKRVLVLEPIVFMLFASVLVFVVVYGTLWGLFNDVQMQMMGSYESLMATSFTEFILRVSSAGPIIIMLYSSISVLVLNVMKVKEVKNESRVQAADLYSTSLCWLLLILSKHFNLNLDIAMLLFVVFTVLSNILSYYLFLRTFDAPNNCC